MRRSDRIPYTSKLLRVVVSYNSSESSQSPPRVLLVMPDQWARALLRAALRDVGYDAVGTDTLEAALRVRAVDPERGAVRLVIVDQPALSGAGGESLARLLANHGAPASMLLARATVESPSEPWQRVLRRPVSVADVVSATAALLPLPAADRHPLD
jgi:DNA-binding response OmpR family regulator